MMTPFGPQPLNHCLLSTPTLLSVQQKIKQLRQLDQKLQALLPPPLPHRCRVANYRQGILVIETANASWLSRLRYEQMRLLSALRQQSLPALTAIEFIINPSFNLPGTAPRRPAQQPTACKPISPQSARQLEQLAQQAPPGLRAILLKLAALALTPFDGSAL